MLEPWVNDDGHDIQYIDYTNVAQLKADKVLSERTNYNWPKNV